MSIAFMFPGQGSQSVGMGFSLIPKLPGFEAHLNETLRLADAQLGFSLSKILQEGPAEKLQETSITQPAILTVSIAVSRWLGSLGIRAEIALGHSLGEYSALVYSEALHFEEAIKIVHQRGRFMSEACAPGTAGMAALVGADREKAENLCRFVTHESQEFVSVSLYNSAQQIVVSGTKKALEMAGAKAKDFGIRKVVILDVSGPFHCPLLQKASIQLGEFLKDTTFNEPKLPVISNATAQTYSKSNDKPHNLLKRQVSEPVLWEQSMQEAWKLGFRTFVEVGDSQVLSGLAGKILPEAQIASLESLLLSHSIKS